MKVNVEGLPGSRKRIEVELDESEVEWYFGSCLREFSKRAQIPGFRKGKVPGNILEKRLGKGLQADVLQKMVDETFRKVCEEKGIVPLSEPSLDSREALPEKGKQFSFTITVETKPKVDIESYKELELERKKVEVTDEDVEAVLQRKREEHAEFLPVSGRPAMRGDWILLDGKSFVDEKPFQDFSDYLVELGSDGLPDEMNTALVGSSPGEEKEANSTTKTGEKVTYRFKVKAIKERRLLIVNDDFARDVGGFGSLAQLRIDIKKELEEIANEEVIDDLRRQIREKLLAKAKVDLPQSLVDKQAGHLQELSRAFVGKTKMRRDDEELKKAAGAQIKEHLIIDEISRRENVAVSDEELEREKAEIVAKGEARRVRPDDEDLRWSLKREKTYDLILSHAKIQDKGESLIITPDEFSSLERKERMRRHAV